MTVALRYAARSDVGLVRDGNEDSVYAGPRLLAVADGMGGHAAGEVASALVIAAVSPLDHDVPPADLLGALRDAVQGANRRLAEVVAGDATLRGMGTTLTALLAADGRLGVVHVGDSRAYLLRDGELRQLTSDHTLVQALVDEGRISAEEAQVHPKRSYITRTLNGDPVELDLSLREAVVGDRYLLCSDGLSGVVSHATLTDTLAGEPDPQRCADRLVELALRGGGPDNVTCVVADVVDAERAPLAGPVVAGAAAPGADDGRGVDGELPDTAAGRAARSLRRSPRHAAVRRPVADAAAGDVAATGRRRRWWLAAGAATVVLLAAVAGLLALRAQVYVGADRDEVVVLRGVSGSVLGVPLHSVHQRTGIPLAQLPAYEQSQVRAGIDTSGLAGAGRVVAQLRAALGCPSGVGTAPTPAPPPSPSPAPNPTPTPAPAAAGCPR